MQKITFNKKGQEIMHNQDQIIQWIGLIIVYIYIYSMENLHKYDMVRTPQILWRISMDS